MFKVERTPGRWRYILRPNRSASWFEIKLFFALVAGVSVIIATVFALAGYWPVLPFAGLELTLLWFCLHHNAMQGRETEVIDIDERQVAIEQRGATSRRHWTFERAWARLRLESPAARLHPCRLVLGSHGRTVRLGRFLAEGELRELATQLRTSLANP